MKDEKSSAQDPDGTRVDLGDDLLEKTRIIPGSIVPSKAPPVSSSPLSSPSTTPSTLTSPTPPSTLSPIADQIQSAKILMNEGLVEDAKKVLHHVLIADPGVAEARDLLNQIHDLELKQIFSGDDRRSPFKKKTTPLALDVDVEQLMHQLDRDLELGIFTEAAWGDSADSFSLFQDPELLDDFCVKLERLLKDGSPQDWIDLGIGFLEMSFYSIAARLFSGACRQLEALESTESEQFLSATSLLALTHVLVGRPFEAVARLQPLIRNPEIRKESKVELFYLMGRTYEAMRKQDLAIEYYRQALEIEPHYRDVDRRMGQIRRSLSE